jgi:hypothetical protein
MPRAIISPSVLASDFGQLTAECKRMIKGGAEWLHMGMLFATCRVNHWNVDHRRYGRVILSTTPREMLIIITSPSAISSLILPWVSPMSHVHVFDSVLIHHRCSHFGVCLEKCSWDIHGLPYDGRRTRESESLLSVSLLRSIMSTKWVDDIADAGGSLYCFHLEATCKAPPSFF